LCAPGRFCDVIEVELETDSKNDYECVIFEDTKGVGFKPARRTFDIRASSFFRHSSFAFAGG
jgi:hypothetical protein